MFERKKPFASAITFSSEFVLPFLAQFQIPHSPPLKPPPPHSPPPPPPPSPPPPPHPLAAAARDPSHGKAPASTLATRRSPDPVPPPARRAAARALPGRAQGRRLRRPSRRQYDTPALEGSRPPRRPAPAGRQVVHPGRVQRPAGGAAVGAVLRQVRQRRPRLLRQRGAREPQQGRAPRRGGPLPGGALRVAPRQGHPRRGRAARGHRLRHRVRAQEPLEVALRGPAGLQAVGLRQDERRRRRRRRQVEGQERCSSPEVEERSSWRRAAAPGAEVRTDE